MWAGKYEWVLVSLPLREAVPFHQQEQKTYLLQNMSCIVILTLFFGGSVDLLQVNNLSVTVFGSPCVKNLTHFVTVAILTFIMCLHDELFRSLFKS